MNNQNQMTVESSFMVDDDIRSLHQRMSAVLQLIETSVDYKLLGTSITYKSGGIGWQPVWAGHIFYRSTAGVLRHGI